MFVDGYRVGIETRLPKPLEAVLKVEHARENCHCEALRRNLVGEHAMSCLDDEIASQSLAMTASTSVPCLRTGLLKQLLRVLN